MSATVIINRLTGAGPTKTNVTSATSRINAADNPSPGTANPIAIPGAGSAYSFWGVFRLEVTVAPATAISNIRAYTDGANGFGTGVTFVGNGATSYVQATGVAGTSGDQLTAGVYATLYGSPSNMFAFTAGAPLALAGSIGAATGDLGDRLVCQFVVGTTASPGATAQETIYFIFDES